MAVVYKALDEGSREVVLLKALRPGADEAVRERFAKEVRLAQAVDHRNVVRVLRATDEALVAEWVEGADLGALVEAHGPLPAALVVEVGREVAAGLGAVHRAGVLHRDLSPANVLIGADGRVRVTDFGLASLAPEAHEDAHEEVRGTLPTLAPEVVGGAPPDARSDLFSLGAVLAFALTGRAPFEGRDASETLDRVLHADPVPALRADPRVPGPLADVLARLLAKDPAARPADAREALALLHASRDATGHADEEALAAWVADPASWTPPAPVEPTAPAEPAEPPHEEGPPRGLTVPLLVLAVLVGALALTWALWPREPVPEERASVEEPAATPPVSINEEVSDEEAAEPPNQEAENEEAPVSLGVPPPTRERDLPPATQGTAPPRTQPEVARPSIPPPGAPFTAPPRAGTLRISAEPWARVRVDGREVGTTPFGPLSVASGTREVTFTNPDFPPHTVRVEVPPGGEAAASVSLWSLVGRITLDVRPWGEVSVDGRPWDTVPPQTRPLVLAPGAHVVRIEHPTLGVREVPLTVSAGEERTLRVRYDAP